MAHGLRKVLKTKMELLKVTIFQMLILIITMLLLMMILMMIIIMLLLVLLLVLLMTKQPRSYEEFFG